MAINLLTKIDISKLNLAINDSNQSNFPFDVSTVSNINCFKGFFSTSFKFSESRLKRIEIYLLPIET